ncbi:HAD family hydrolase [Actinomyces oricola]|uniref:HAD family hydrolase n=1 Tax=Actinomyces oricola TaxID=206043 RepID=UPI000FFEF481|nr:HAD family phosphatase [Actinomyces oricola]
MSTVAYDTAIVDYGNVLVAWEPLAAVAGHLSVEQWEEFVTGAGFYALNSRSDAGEPFEDIVADLERTHPERPDWAAALRLYRSRDLYSLTGPVPGVARVLTELHEQGIRLLGLTNFDHTVFPDAIPLAPVLELFDGIVVSGAEHLTKPDPALYRILLERYDVDPARAVFIDDSEANIAGAQQVGITGLHFTGAGRLRCDLVALGLLPHA